MQIETNRLLLREYVESDWAAVHEYAQQESILIYEAWGPNTEEDTKGFIYNAIADSKKNTRSVFEIAIVLKEKEMLIGGTSFRIHPDNKKRADFGYIINPKYWKQGFATEASMGLINFMIEDQGLTEIEATCDQLNKASQRVLEKCGLLRVKLLKNHKQFKGDTHDTCVYEKLVTE